jgi:hypothetical protein
MSKRRLRVCATPLQAPVRPKSTCTTRSLPMAPLVIPRPSIYLRANRLGTRHADPLLSSLTIACPDRKSRTARQARLRTLYGRGPDCLLEVVGPPQSAANVSHSRTPLHPASSGCREIRRSKVYPDSICSSQPQDLTTSWNDHGHGAYDFSRSEPKFPLSLPQRTWPYRPAAFVRLT